MSMPVVATTSRDEAAVAHAFAAACCPPACDDSADAAEQDQATANKMAELTMASACMPAGVAVATGEGASAAAAELAGCRLASSNQFVLNPDEPQRSMQELVQGLMEELEGGENARQQRRTARAAIATRRARGACFPLTSTPACCVVLCARCLQARRI